MKPPIDLDEIDRKLLNLVQSQLPVVVRPYLELGEKLGITEAEVMERLQKLQDWRIIRRLGAVFDSRKIGYSGTLCAMQVPEERLEEVAAIVNRYSGVTHNYLRENVYNMWFTLLASGVEAINRILEQIKQDSGIEEILELPAERIFKIKVNFALAEQGLDAKC